MTCAELFELVSALMQNQDYHQKPVLVVDHTGREVGIAKTIMSTSHWPCVALYTEEPPDADRL